MSLNSVSIPFIIFLIATFDIASGLKCYSCYHFNKEGAMNPSCKNPTPGETPTTRNATLEKALHSRIKQDPGKARQSSREICGILVGTFNGFDGIIRVKGGYPTTQPNGCENSKEYIPDLQAEFVGKACSCDTDLCNGKDDPGSYVSSSGRILSIGLIASTAILLTCLA